MERSCNNTEKQSPKFECRHNIEEEMSCQMLVDNSQNVLKFMKILHDEHLMCDVYLSVGMKEYPAHRLILCASSDVFMAMLTKPEWSECHESRVVLLEQPHCERVFHSFLEYFYTGKIIITHTNILGILMLADKYIVKSLSRLCLEYMSHHVSHAAHYNVLSTWLNYVISCGYKELENTCFNYIKWNLCAVANTSDFGDFDTDILVKLLQQNDVVVLNEMVLYNFVVRWLELQRIKLQQSGMPAVEVDRQIDVRVELLMMHIRFPMMTPRELAELLLSPLVQRYRDLFMERLVIGMSFHSNQTTNVEETFTTPDDLLLFTPRLYTSDSYSALLQIEHVRSLISYQNRTFVFSSHISCSEKEKDKIVEWAVDVYPKGVWFKKCSLILWQGQIEVPEEIIRTVRVSVACQKMSQDDVKVRVSLLLYARQGTIEHIMGIIQRDHYFNEHNRVLNIDNIIPFEELNPPAYTQDEIDNKYLTGTFFDQLKINLVITPLH